LSEFVTISLLNGVSYGLLLFMLSSGLTLIFSMMGVLNFAHTSFYMLGAYLAYTISGVVGFWPALVLAPLAVFALGALFERYSLRKVHKWGHVPELLVTFGLSYLILELVQLIWGRSTVPYGLPTQLQGPLFTLYGTQFPKSRSFIMLVALVMLASVWLLLTRTRIGLVIQAALTHPDRSKRWATTCRASSCWCSAAAPRWRAWPASSAATPTSPSRRWPLGRLHHLRGGGGRRHGLAGRRLPRLAADRRGADLRRGARLFARHAAAGTRRHGHARLRYPLLSLTISQVAPILPYLFLVLILIFRPKGLLGTRED
jgi:branched-chain amino acid transport system permease protein